MCVFERRRAQMQTRVSPCCTLCTPQRMRRSLKAEPLLRRSASAFHRLLLMFPDEQRRQSAAAKRGHETKQEGLGVAFLPSFSSLHSHVFCARRLTSVTWIVSEAELVAQHVSFQQEAKITLENY